MKEFKAIVAAYHTIDFTRQKGALATIVRVTGSSYRSPGTRMLISGDGRWFGSISGGCLEGDALRKARQVMSDNVPLMVRYDTNEESNQQLGINLGCNGIIDVLLEPIVPDAENNPIKFVNDFITTSEPVALATIFSGRGIGGKILMTLTGVVKNSFENELLQEAVIADLRNIFEDRRSEPRYYTIDDEEYGIFLELIQPSISLLIFGGGVDARPVSQLAKKSGWNVEVTDECAAHIAPIFFPDADKLSLCRREFLDVDFTITPFTACLLMSHNYEYDLDVLKKLVKTDTPYIGIMGPLRRMEKMKAAFALRGEPLTAHDLDRIHAPVGVDIGAETADEIAVAIIAEILAVFSSRTAGFLKSKNTTIHQRDIESDDVYKPVYLK
jgi:xanthine dehydrogenase accessory factor